MADTLKFCVTDQIYKQIQVFVHQSKFYDSCVDGRTVSGITGSL